MGLPTVTAATPSVSHIQGTHAPRLLKGSHLHLDTKHLPPKAAWEKFIGKGVGKTAVRRGSRSKAAGVYGRLVDRDLGRFNPLRPSGAPLLPGKVSLIPQGIPHPPPSRRARGSRAD